MINAALFKKEVKSSWKLFSVIALLLAMYIVIIITMYDSSIQETLDRFVVLMPKLMESVGMKAGGEGLLAYLSSYLYGFILILFPLVFSTLTANRLIARYADNGSLAQLLAAPVTRGAVARTQIAVQVSGIVLIILYITLLEIGTAAWSFPGALDRAGLFRLNGGLLALHLFIGAFSFFFSCLFSDQKQSLAFGLGIPTIMYVMKMLDNVGVGWTKYLTVLSLYRPEGLLGGDKTATWFSGILAAGAIVLYMLAYAVFQRKDFSV